MNWQCRQTDLRLVHPAPSFAFGPFLFEQAAYSAAVADAAALANRK